MWLKSGVSQARNSAISQAVCWCTVLLEDAIQVKLFPHTCNAIDSARFFVSAAVKLHKFVISEPDKVHHRSMVATDSTSWDKQACTHNKSAAFWMAYLTLTR